MEKLHHIGLLILNFTILNIILSLFFFAISCICKKVSSSISVRSRVFFISLMAPPVLSSFILITSFIPPFFIKPHDGPMPCLNEPYCYIFSFIPEFPMFRVALIAAIGLALMSVLYSTASLGGYLRMCRAISKLPESSGMGTAETGMSKLKIRIIETDQMFSFVWGYLPGVIVISTGALVSLSMDELKCLLAHELSHYRRRDNLLKYLLLLCRNSLFMSPHVHTMFRWWTEEIELIGDDAAVLMTGKPLDAASAILKMQRMPATGLNLNVLKFATGFTASGRCNPLTRRVERLVAINDSRIKPRKVRFDLCPSETGIVAGLTFIFPVLFGMIYEIDPLMIHCYLEKLTSVF